MKRIKKDEELQIIDYRYDEGFRGRTEHDVCSTLTTKSSGISGCPMIMKMNGRQNIMSKMRIRKLVPCETMRLMGFTKKDYNSLKEINQSDAQIYHECGDSLVVPLFAMLVGTMLPISECELKNIVENYIEEVKL